MHRGARRFPPEGRLHGTEKWGRIGGLASSGGATGGGRGARVGTGERAPGASSGASAGAAAAARGRRMVRAEAGAAMPLRGVEDVPRVLAGKFKRRRSDAGEMGPLSPDGLLLSQWVQVSTTCSHPSQDLTS